MRFTALAASVLVLSLSVPWLTDSASAQSFNKRGNGGQGQGRRGGNDEEDIDAPINTNKFPGVGSFDSWKTSVPEFRSGLDKMRAHRWDEAIAHFRASIALYEYQPQAWLHEGQCIERKGGLLSDAEQAYRHCLKLDNQSWNGWKCLGNVLYMEKKYDESRQSISNAMNLSAPPKQKEKMRKMIQMMDAAQSNANTQQMNTGQ